MQAGYQVAWLPSYGPEMRGGTANCHVRISDTEIGSPLVAESDVLIAMNRPSLEKFEHELEPGGLLLYDSRLITIKPTRTDIDIIAIPATEIADAHRLHEVGQHGDARRLREEDRHPRSRIRDRGLPSFIKAKRTIPLNQQAIEKGAAFVR